MPNDTASPRRRRGQYLDGTRLRERRTEAGLSQEKLAVLVDATQGRVAHWEAGHDDPGIEATALLAKALGCDMHELMHEEGVKALAELAEAIASGKAA